MVIRDEPALPPENLAVETPNRVQVRADYIYRVGDRERISPVALVPRSYRAGIAWQAGEFLSLYVDPGNCLRERGVSGGRLLMRGPGVGAAQGPPRGEARQ